LQQRPGLVHDDLVNRALLVQGPDDPEPGAPAQAGQGAGVAVGVQPERPLTAGLPEVRGATPADLVARRGGELDNGQGRGLDGLAALRDLTRDRGDLAA
jgi:hypothetical protein